MFTIKEIIKSTQGTLVNADVESNVQVDGVSIDSRSLKNNDLFIALCGDNFDGHDYIFKVIEKQARAVICDAAWACENLKDINNANVPIISVENTVAALSSLAKTHRKKFSIPVIAVTGSNGKTTTKNMIAAILQAKYKVLKNKASFNNHIGVPLTLLDLDITHQVAVIEIGMNHKGEIRNLASIAMPDMAVITNAATAHIEFFNAIDDIIEAKCELLESLAPGSVAVVNADCKLLYLRARDFDVDIVDFGIKSSCAYQASNVISHSDAVSFTVNQKYTFKMHLLGEHNVYNALAAIAIACHLKVDYSLIRTQMLEFKPVPLRMQTLEYKAVVIIADCYNANLDSTTAAINTLESIKDKKRKIFVFGDMLELGTQSDQAHRQIGELIAHSSIGKLITVGQNAGNAAKTAHECGMNDQDIYRCKTNEDAAQVLEELINQDDVVLLKGSRAMRLEQIVDLLKK